MKLYASIFDFAEKLDRRSFLQCRLWMFLLGNLFRIFPHYFFFRIMAPHPCVALSGIKRYRRLVADSRGDELRGTLNRNDWDERIESPFLIGLGFCLKPMNQENGASLCPAGFFNHRCRLLELSSSVPVDELVWPAPCSKCGIAPFIMMAGKIGMDIYIMTSALDIARNVFLPAIKGVGPHHGLFFLCPYSAEPFTFGLAVAQIQAAIVVYNHGNCQNHVEWTLADRGIKKNQTTIEPSGLAEWVNRFQAMTPAGTRRFMREKEVYRAVKQAGAM